MALACVDVLETLTAVSSACGPLHTVLLVHMQLHQNDVKQLQVVRHRHRSCVHTSSVCTHCFKTCTARYRCCDACIVRKIEAVHHDSVGMRPYLEVPGLPW